WQFSATASRRRVCQPPTRSLALPGLLALAAEHSLGGVGHQRNLGSHEASIVGGKDPSRTILGFLLPAGDFDLNLELVRARSLNAPYPRAPLRESGHAKPASFSDPQWSVVTDFQSPNG